MTPMPSHIILLYHIILNCRQSFTNHQGPTLVGFCRWRSPFHNFVWWNQQLSDAPWIPIVSSRRGSPNCCIIRFAVELPWRLPTPSALSYRKNTWFSFFNHVYDLIFWVLEGSFDFLSHLVIQGLYRRLNCHFLPNFCFMLNRVFTAFDVGLDSLGAFDVLGHFGNEGGAMEETLE